MTSTVDLLDLAAAALSASIVASDHVTSLARQRDGNGEETSTEASSTSTSTSSSCMNIRLKEDGSIVTDADLAAQQIIVQAIQKVSKTVRLVGEESEELMEQHTITGHEKRLEEIFLLAKEEIKMRHQKASGKGEGDLNVHNLSVPLPLAQLPLPSPYMGLEEKEILHSAPLAEHVVDTERVAVFVDPLDGTKAYARGDYAPVSILIAIILDQAPCFGVICKPFGHTGQASVLDTGCVAIYGGTLLGDVYTAGGGHCAKVVPTCHSSLQTPSIPIEDLPRAVISSSRSQGIVEEFVSYLGYRGMIHPTPLLISGAGEKSLRIILRSEKEGLWFFPKPGTSLWDVAASDALLRATGGRLTDKNGRDMDYSKTRLEADNNDGVVACYDKLLHAECIRLFLEGSWAKKS